MTGPTPAHDPDRCATCNPALRRARTRPAIAPLTELLELVAEQAPLDPTQAQDE